MTKRCATCTHWLTKTPDAVYRADCALGMLTRPEEWQRCDLWSDRNGPPAPAPQGGSITNYWGHYWGLAQKP